MDPITDFLTTHDYVGLPLERTASGHLLVSHAMVNGREARLYLDTGAGQTIIDMAFAQQLNLPLTEDSRRIAGAGGGLKVFNTIVAQFSLGGEIERDYACRAADLSHVNNALRQRNLAPMDGVIGGDLLKRREALIDCRREQLFFKRVGAAAA